MIYDELFGNIDDREIQVTVSSTSLNELKTWNETVRITYDDGDEFPPISYEFQLAVLGKCDGNRNELRPTALARSM